MKHRKPDALAKASRDDEVWIVRRGSDEYRVKDLVTLRQYAAAGRIQPNDEIYNPWLRKLQRANEVAGLDVMFSPSPPPASLDTEATSSSTNTQDRGYRPSAGFVLVIGAIVALILLLIAVPYALGLLVLLGIGAFMRGLDRHLWRDQWGNFRSRGRRRRRRFFW